jgi:pimeloyl-ACP methyl ester carboxylesterase
MHLKTFSIATDRGNFHAQLLGERGPWVVCWPSQLNDFECMKDFALMLAQDFRVVLCDPLGVGLNQSLPYCHNINELVYYAQRVMTKLDIKQCHWVGYGAGGVLGVALRLALPEQICSLTLASAPMLSQSRFKLHVAATTALLAGSRFGRQLLSVRASKEMGYADPREKALVINYLREVLERVDRQSISKLRPLDGASVRRMFDKLRTQAPPILVLCGRHDRIVLPRDQRTVAEITNARFVDLNCGHMSLLAKPEACAHAFQRFAQTLEARQPDPRTLAA